MLQTKTMHAPVISFWIAGRKSFGASGIGGMKETQDMLDSYGVHHIVAEIELTRNPGHQRCI